MKRWRDDESAVSVIGLIGEDMKRWRDDESAVLVIVLGVC